MKKITSLFVASLIITSLTAAFGMSKVFAIDQYKGLCAAAAQNNNNTAPGVCDPSVANPTNPLSGDDSLLMRVITLITIVAGIVAVVMIIITAVKLILSNGDSAKFNQARTTLIYLGVGIVVLLLAKPIISFILNHI